jgi:hypothetical protein
MTAIMQDDHFTAGAWATCGSTSQLPSEQAVKKFSSQRGKMCCQENVTHVYSLNETNAYFMLIPLLPITV